MGALTIVSNATSFLLIMACWWLTHVYASGGSRSCRLISALCGVFGFFVMMEAVFRNAGAENDWIRVSSDIVITMVFVAVAFRVERLRASGRSASPCEGRDRT